MNIQPTEDLIVGVSLDYGRQVFEGHEMMTTEVAEQLAALIARGHTVHVEIHVDDPDHMDGAS